MGVWNVGDLLQHHHLPGLRELLHSKASSESFPSPLGLL
jgi:hypothetical protein